MCMKQDIFIEQNLLRKDRREEKEKIGNTIFKKVWTSPEWKKSKQAKIHNDKQAGYRFKEQGLEEQAAIQFLSL